MRLCRRKSSKSALFSRILAEKNFFFEVDILNRAFFCNWLTKYATALPKIGKILRLIAEMQNFFAVDILNYVIFCSWLSKYATALPKIGKIYAFFISHFLKCEIFVYSGRINMQLFLQKLAEVTRFIWLVAKRLFFFSWLFAIWFSKSAIIK